MLWFHEWHDLKSLPSTLTWWWQWIYCISEVFQKVVIAIYSTLWIYHVALARFNLLIHFARFKFLLKNKQRVADITCIRFRLLATRQKLYATLNFQTTDTFSSILRRWNGLTKFRGATSKQSFTWKVWILMYLFIHVFSRSDPQRGSQSACFWKYHASNYLEYNRD